MKKLVLCLQNYCLLGPRIAMKCLTEKMTIAELKDNFIEFDSMINFKPMENNLSRSVENSDIRKQISDIVNGWIL